MIRNIIKINPDACNGCGLCADACHEGAIAMVDGKAKLMRDDYCDGLGNCLPVCPTGAISFEEREAAAFDEAAVKARKEQKNGKNTLPMDCGQEDLPCGCPGTNVKTFSRCESATEAQAEGPISELRQWPVQIKLVPLNAPYFENAHLLIAADCAAYAYAGFHGKFMKNKVTIIGCPKLDDTDYSAKLGEIITGNNIKSVAVVRMEVPCCGGIEQAAITALRNSDKFLPWQIYTLTTSGRIE